MRRLRSGIGSVAQVVPSVIYGLTVVSLVFASFLPGGLQEFFATAAYVGIALSALTLLLTGRAA